MKQYLIIFVNCWDNPMIVLFVYQKKHLVQIPLDVKRKPTIFFHFYLLVQLWSKILLTEREDILVKCRNICNNVIGVTFDGSILRYWAGKLIDFRIIQEDQAPVEKVLEENVGRLGFLLDLDRGNAIISFLPSEISLEPRITARSSNPSFE